MNTSRNSYKDYSFAHHAEVYRLVEQTCAHFGIHYYLIGANARDVALYKAGVRPARGTADVDFAVMLADMEGYEAFKLKLKSNGFEDAKGGEPYRLFHRGSNTVIDLLPYGEIAQNYTVTFTERSVELSTVGMNEVGQHREDFESEPGVSVPVSPAHGIVILKMIAWSERPERTKDLDDIASLLEAAWELYEKELYVEDAAHADVFDADDFDTEIAGAIVMGRKMREVLMYNHELKTSIHDMIEKDLIATAGPISMAIAKAMKKDLAHAKRVLKAIQKGIEDNL